MSDKPRPCPFCGSEHTKIHHADHCSLYCQDCGGEGSYCGERAEAIARWNAADQAWREQNERLRAENNRLNAQIQDELIERQQSTEKIVSLRAALERIHNLPSGVSPFDYNSVAALMAVTIACRALHPTP